jgi:hypothetical protein
MTEDFVKRSQAKKLKELGFDELVLKPNKSLKMYHITSLSKINEGAAPTYSQAFRWFRDNYNFHHYIEPIYRNSKVKYEFCVVASAADDKDFNEDELESYEGAESACLDELIKILEEKKK